ncbi:putative glycerate kinase [Beggiatoa alba B18LD]|uniref:Putative glycerate kinase n=1 Tax=Beggiatoa alba B18LD TaxID=395493 RepID=I3CD00_9GAMM|nr:DUF4147 domain-containing protein [Beggiatoa alba]EIJ41493.1 putative glycerate kinase [Beggiatoa alba B18LD]
MMPNVYRQHLLAFYRAALLAVNGRNQTANFLRQHVMETPCALIAIGKAASEMALGAYEVLGAQITCGLVISKYGYINQAELQAFGAVCLESAHPVPNVDSLRAGEELLQFIHALPPKYPVLCLVSGGASSLVEVPIASVNLETLQAVNQWLLASGLNIQAMNSVRKNLSQIKGGRLAHYLVGHPVMNLLISDVPQDDLQVIGSGLLVPSNHEHIPSHLPDWINALLRGTEPTCPLNCYANIQHFLIASPSIARHAIIKAAQARGYTPYIQSEFIQGDAIKAGEKIANFLLDATQGVYIWSSETTVQLPAVVGEGGRCQMLALSAARVLLGQFGIYLLAAGTDGEDGNNKVAGALVDSGTVARGEILGLDCVQHLQKANAGQFLEQTNDLIYTGATGTNVMDVLIGLVTE